VFTTLAIRDGKPLSARPHIRRLTESAATLYGLALDTDRILRDVFAEASRVPGPGRMRVETTPEGRITLAAKSSAPSETFPRKRLELADPIVIPGGLGEHKWIDRTIVDGPEALLVDLDGTVLESTRGSIWIVEGDRIVTPPTDGRILPGVTRQYVLAFEDAAVEEVPYERLLGADDAFVTSAVRGLQPLAGYTPSPTTDRVILHLAATASLALAGR
jgi:para-aminobenzoate synthetase/4-amino-4-deoxychorismate lyase